jgi:hypothetical protein
MKTGRHEQAVELSDEQGLQLRALGTSRFLLRGLVQRVRSSRGGTTKFIILSFLVSIT